MGYFGLEAAHCPRSTINDPGPEIPSISIVGKKRTLICKVRTEPARLCVGAIGARSKCPPSACCLSLYCLSRSVIGRSSVCRSDNAAKGQQSSGSPPTVPIGFLSAPYAAQPRASIRSDMSVCTKCIHAAYTYCYRPRPGGPDLALATELPLQCYNSYPNKESFGKWGLRSPCELFTGLFPPP